MPRFNSPLLLEEEFQYIDFNLFFQSIKKHVDNIVLTLFY